MTGARPEEPAPRAKGPEPPEGLAGPRLPPVTELVVTSLALMLAGGVVMAAQLPGHPSLAAPTALLVAGACLTAMAVALLGRARPFAWQAFYLVARWALLAYLVIAGLLVFVFVYDGTSGATLAVLVATLAVFAVDVPTSLAFTVARYHGPGPTGPGLAAGQTAGTRSQGPFRRVHARRRAVPFRRDRPQGAGPEDVGHQR